MIPGGTPNTPVRRLSYTIKNAITLPDLCRLIQRNRQKITGGVWLDKHEAAVLDRAADLSYHRAMQSAGDGQVLRETLEDLMQLSALRSLRPPVIKLLEGRTILRLLSSLAHAECSPSRLPLSLLTALVLELGRGGGNKMPQDGSSIAELYWCIAVLNLLPQSQPQATAPLQPHPASDHLTAPGPKDNFYRHSPVSTSARIPNLSQSQLFEYTWMELERCAILALQMEVASPTTGMDLEDLSKLAWAASVTGQSHRALSGSSEDDLMGYIEKIGVKILKPNESNSSSSQNEGEREGEINKREARLVASLAHSFGKERRKCPELMPLLCQTFSWHLSQGVTQESVKIRETASLKTKYNKSATGAKSSSSVSGSSVAEGLHRPMGSSVSGSSVAKIMWAMATLGHKDSNLISQLSALILSPSWLYSLNLNGDELAHITWSFSVMQHHKSKVFEALGKAFMNTRMYGTSDTQLALIATSFVPLATSTIISPSVVSGVYRTISRLASGRTDMRIEDLVEIVWSLANVKDPNSLLLEVATQSTMRALKANPSSVPPGTIAMLLSSLKQSKEIGLVWELTNVLHQNGNAR